MGWAIGGLVIFRGLQEPNNNATEVPKIGEINLMKYYTNSLIPERVVASEKDVLGLLWLSKIEIKRIWKQSYSCVYFFVYLLVTKIKHFIVSKELYILKKIVYQLKMLVYIFRVGVII